MCKEIEDSAKPKKKMLNESMDSDVFDISRQESELEEAAQRGNRAHANIPPVRDDERLECLYVH